MTCDPGKCGGCEEAHSVGFKGVNDGVEGGSDAVGGKE